jgi:hypothetical protein
MMIGKHRVPPPELLKAAIAAADKYDVKWRAVNARLLAGEAITVNHLEPELGELRKAQHSIDEWTEAQKIEAALCVVL